MHHLQLLAPFGTAALVILLAITPATQAATRARFTGETAMLDAHHRLALGFDHSCLVGRDGRVRCWGAANRLGARDSVNHPIPVEAVGLQNAVAVTVGGAHTCALVVDGTVSCWGTDNAFGQMGMLLGTTVPDRGPRPLPGVLAVVKGAVAVKAGGSHTCALRADGFVLCWGNNVNGQVGASSGSEFFAPRQVSGITSAVALTAGGNHTCALLAGGTVRCWGRNVDGQLGDGTTLSRFNPQDVVGLTGAVAIAAGGSFTCALLSDSSVRCWGTNLFGQLGNGTTSMSLTPVRVNLNADNIADVVVGREHACALAADGGVRCWGASYANGTTADQLNPVPVAGIPGAVAIAGGFRHTCALLDFGMAQCWGQNGMGQLGDGQTAASPMPVLVSTSAVFGTPRLQGIAAGEQHTCAVQDSGPTSCWGGNVYGQLGDGTTTLRLTPTPGVTGLPGAATAVTAGRFHTCAQLVGDVRCWGSNEFGQLGDGSKIAMRPTAAPVSSAGRTKVLGITAGDSHNCMVLTTGRVECWGLNDFGQLGNGSTLNRPAPETNLVVGAKAVAAGGSHTCAALTNGTVQCWGRNLNGQLGTGGFNDSLTPQTVPGLSNVVALAAGRTHTCALLANGTAQCWGDNSAGQLGNRTNTASPIPVQVSFGVPDFIALAVGDSYSCAIRVGGIAVCWGLNNSGQLGDGSSANRPTPAAVTFAGIFPGPISRVARLATGNGNGCAVSAPGGLVCWGANALGQVGDGTTTTRFRAVTVPAFAFF